MQIERVTDSLNGEVDRHLRKYTQDSEKSKQALSSQARVPGAGKWRLHVYLGNVTPEFINQSKTDCDSHKIFHQLLKKIFTLNISQLGERIFPSMHCRSRYS